MENQFAAVQQPASPAVACESVAAAPTGAPNQAPSAGHRTALSTTVSHSGDNRGVAATNAFPDDLDHETAPLPHGGRDGGRASDGDDDDDNDGADAAGAAAARPGGGLNSAAELRELIAGEGRSLPCPHVDHNPWPKAPSLRDRAIHYEPAAAGDSVHATIASSLKRVNGDGAKELLQRELCTLVPVCSALYDLDAFLESVQLGVRGAVPASTITQLVATARQQLYAARQLQQERLDELSGANHASRRAAHADLMYDHERSLTGARSALGEFLALSETTRTTTAHLGHAARDRAANARGTPARATLQARGNQQRRAAALLSQLDGNAGSGGGRGGSGGSNGTRQLAAGESRGSSGGGKGSGNGQGNDQGGGGGRGGRGNRSGGAQPPRDAAA